jgi:hypothetical protein
MSSLSKAIEEEASWGYTENGADAKETTGSACLDLFARSGAMRGASIEEKKLALGRAYKEDPDIAVKLLFYTRDIRGGYGERDTFNDMLAHLATLNVESVTKNLWAVLEFGRAKDLYSLIGTPAEDDMWQFMKNQFETDLKNMEAEKSVSLLAKWIATPDASSSKTKELGKLTAKKLGYDFENMKDYKKKLRALRKYIDIPEAKMCSGAWDTIEYAKCSSNFLLKNRKALQKHDETRWNKYIENVSKGTETIHTGTITPCDIISKVARSYTPELEVMWNNLEDVCSKNVMVMADSSGSMTRSIGSSMRPIDVAAALAIYFAQRNKGDLKNLFMTFSSHPKFIKLDGQTLEDNFYIVSRAEWQNSTNIEAAFDLLLNTMIKANLQKEDMPDAIMVISDMQFNPYNAHGIDSDRMLFFDAMKKKYNDAGYELPQLILWNVNAERATFHATRNTKGASLASGYSVNVFKQIMESIGATPYELMLSVVNDERYKDIVA